MAKRKSKKSGGKLEGIGGLLIPVLILCFYSAISSTWLLIQKITLIVNNQALAGVYVSSILLVLYCVFIWLSIIFILMKKKSAVKMFVFSFISGALFSLWYFFIGQLIYFPQNKLTILRYGLSMVLFNIIVSFLVLFYLKKSKRMKNTLKK